MKALGRKAVVCALVIFALGVSAVIERTKIRKEHKHDILRRYPKHHTVKKILPESKRHATDYAFGTSYAKTRRLLIFIRLNLYVNLDKVWFLVLVYLYS